MVMAVTVEVVLLVVEATEAVGKAGVAKEAEVREAAAEAATGVQVTPSNLEGGVTVAVSVEPAAAWVEEVSVAGVV